MKNKKFILIAILYFLYSVGTNLIHPITTPFIQNQLKFDSLFFGIYYALMSFGLVVGAFLCGFICQKVSRKILIGSGFVGYSIFQLLFGVVNFNPYIVMIWRFFSGFSIAFPNTLFIVYALEYLKSENRVKGLALMTSMNLLGVSVGYELGGIMHETFWINNYLASFLLQCIWCVICAIICFILIDNKKMNKKSQGFAKVIKHLNVKQIVFFIALFIFSVAAINVSKYFEPFFQNIDNQRFSPSDLAHFTTISNIISILVNLLVIPLIKKKAKSKASLLFTIFLAINSVFLIIVFSFKDPRILLILLFSLYLLYIVIRNLITPLEQNVAVELGEENDYPELLSLRQALFSLGQVVGPLFAAWIFSYNMRLPFYISSGLYLISFFLMIVYLVLKCKANKKTNSNTD